MKVDTDVLEAVRQEYLRYQGRVTFIPVSDDLLERMESDDRLPTEEKPLEITGVLRRENGLIDLRLRNPDASIAG